MIASQAEYFAKSARYDELLNKGYAKLTAEEADEAESILSEMQVWNLSRTDTLQRAHGLGPYSAPGAQGAAPSLPQSRVELGRHLQCEILSAIDHKPAEAIHSSMFSGAGPTSFDTQSAGNHSAGGAWIHGGQTDRFIPLLHPHSTIRRMGATVLPLTDGSLPIAKQTSGPTGQYLGELEEAEVELLAAGSCVLVSKELVAMSVSTEKLLRSPSANASSRILDTTLAAVGATEDLYFLRGNASGAGPTGIRYQADPTQIVAATATGVSPSIAAIDLDLGRLETMLLLANVRMSKAGWIMSPRTLVHMKSMRDGNGNLAYPGLSEAMPMLRGKPVYHTTQIPVNLGSGSDESEIMLVDANHVLIGDVPNGMNVQSSNVASYKQAGQIKSAYAERRVVTRVVMENDIVLEHDKAVAVLTGIRWGVPE